MPKARVILSATFLLVSTSVSLSATSIVILREPGGGKIVAAADSQFSSDKAAPLIGCKIAQIEREFWTAVSGISIDTSVNFNPYQIALDAAARHKDSLDSIASESQIKAVEPLQEALKHRRDLIGENAFWQEVTDGKSAESQAFWGLDNGVLRVIYVDFILHRNTQGLWVSPSTHVCPGDACPGPRDGFLVILGHHKAIDEYQTTNRDWMRGDIENIARRFVQLEIDGDTDCQCSPPVDVLQIQSSGLQQWIGDPGPLCQQPRN